MSDHASSPPFPLDDARNDASTSRVHKPLRALIVTTNRRRGQDLRRKLRQADFFLPISLHHEPVSLEDLDYLIETERAAVLFLDVENLEESLAVIHELRQLEKGTSIVAFSRSITRDGLLQLIRESVREWIGIRFSPEELTGIVDRVRTQIMGNPPRFEREGQILSFLPAKAGCGTSTVVAHAAALAGEILNRRILLADLDLACGIQGFLHKLSDSSTLTEVMEQSDRMDDALWQRMVGHSGMLDVLRVDNQAPKRPVDPRAIQRLFDFAESRYPLVFTDLSGNWERWAIDTLRRSSAVFLVATTDLASLHLARRNLQTIDHLNLRDRVRLVLNRCIGSGDIGNKAIEEMVGLPPSVRLPNTYMPLQVALREGRLLGSSTPLQKAMKDVFRGIVQISPGECGSGGHSMSAMLGNLRVALSSIAMKVTSRDEVET